MGVHNSHEAAEPGGARSVALEDGEKLEAMRVKQRQDVQASDAVIFAQTQPETKQHAAQNENEDFAKGYAQGYAQAVLQHMKNTREHLAHMQENGQNPEADFLAGGITWEELSADEQRRNWSGRGAQSSTIGEDVSLDGSDLTHVSDANPRTSANQLHNLDTDKQVRSSQTSQDSVLRSDASCSPEAADSTNTFADVSSAIDSDTSRALLKTQSRTTAGLLALLLGAFGLHKFYLGYQNQGFILLSVSVIAGLLTFGIASLVVWLVSAIEGVIYLSKDQPTFERDYVYGRREWF